MHKPNNKEGPQSGFYLYCQITRERAQPMREKVTNVTSSHIGWSSYHWHGSTDRKRTQIFIINDKLNAARRYKKEEFQE